MNAKGRTMAFAVGQRVRLKFDYTTVLKEGAKGDVQQIVTGNFYDVLFDTKADGDPIDPPDPVACPENDLEAD
ncbi:MAG: hypothetical protein O7G85_11585 [Planctomycetota bacterium]|nr:hypothetical protein [Planctomycetota bacterium]